MSLANLGKAKKELTGEQRPHFHSLLLLSLRGREDSQHQLCDGKGTGSVLSLSLHIYHLLSHTHTLSILRKVEDKFPCTYPTNSFSQATRYQLSFFPTPLIPSQADPAVAAALSPCEENAISLDQRNSAGETALFYASARCFSCFLCLVTHDASRTCVCVCACLYVCVHVCM